MQFIQPSTTLNAIFRLIMLLGSAVGFPGESQDFPQGLNEIAALMPKSTLPSPDGLDLKFVILGIGTQIYTCIDGMDDSKPESAGATARLFDIGTYITNNSYAKTFISTVSPVVYSLISYYPHLDPVFQSLGTQHLIGHHFFDNETPVFTLDQLNHPYPAARVQKLQEADAPNTSYPGAAIEGNVQWLLLGDTQGISQGGIDTVYRTETVGGKRPATCKGQRPNFEVHYVAQYWLYGSQRAREGSVTIL